MISTGAMPRNVAVPQVTSEELEEPAAAAADDEAAGDMEAPVEPRSPDVTALELAHCVQQAYMQVELLPITMRVLTFFGTSQTWNVEQECFGALEQFVNCMQRNLQHFPNLLTNLGARDMHNDGIQQSQNVLHFLSIIMADRRLLKESVDALLPSVSCHETKENNNRSMINSSRHLVKEQMRHRHLVDLLHGLSSDYLAEGKLVCNIDTKMARGWVVWISPIEQQ